VKSVVYRESCYALSITTHFNSATGWHNGQTQDIMDPLHITEFASAKYFEKLKQLNERAENASSSSPSAGPAAAATVPPLPLQAPTFTLPLGRQRSHDNDAAPLALRPSEQKKRSLGHDLTALRTQRRPSFSGSFGSLRSKVTVIHKVPSIVEHREDILAEDPTAPLQFVIPNEPLLLLLLTLLFQFDPE
jgi:hypothetical protein